jgi:hypothetical protein
MKLWLLVYYNNTTREYLSQYYSEDEREQLLSGIVSLSEQTGWEGFKTITDRLITEDNDHYMYSSIDKMVSVELHDISGIF